jgi:opacity protein-like surface antigen
MARTISRRARALASALLVLALASPAAAGTAQSPPSTAPSEPADQTGWSARAGLGFTLDPTNLLLTIEAPYMVTNNFGVGPLVQFALSDDWLMIMPTANLHYRFDLSRADSPTLRPLSPFLQGGLGFGWLEADTAFGDVDDTGFLLNVGFGFEYAISEKVSLGNNVLFNILPTEVVGETFIFSWQFATVRYRF